MDKITFRILLIILAVFELALLAIIGVLLSLNNQVPDQLWGAAASITTGILGLAVHTEPTPIAPVPLPVVPVSPEIGN